MYKKLALALLVLSFSGVKAEKPKKFAFRLVQEAEKKFADQIEKMQNEFYEKIKLFEESVNKEEFLKLSVEDKLKLKYLLKNVIRYK